MGFLDNSSVTVDAILTKRGRELLAEGRDKFQITQKHRLGAATMGKVKPNLR